MALFELTHTARGCCLYQHRRCEVTFNTGIMSTGLAAGTRNLAKQADKLVPPQFPEQCAHEGYINWCMVVVAELKALVQEISARLGMNTDPGESMEENSDEDSDEEEARAPQDKPKSTAIFLEGDGQVLPAGIYEIEVRCHSLYLASELLAFSALRGVSRNCYHV